MQEIGLYIAVVLRARTQLLTYAHCWGLASGLTGRVLQKCTQQLTRRTSAQLDGKNNQTDPTQISLFESGRRQGIPETETNCHRYKLDDRTVTRVKSPAQSFLKSSPSSPNKNTRLSCEALHPTPGSFIAWPQSVSSRSPMWEQHKPRMRNRSRVQHVLAACSTCFVGFVFLSFVGCLAFSACFASVPMFSTIPALHWHVLPSFAGGSRHEHLMDHQAFQPIWADFDSMFASSLGIILMLCTCQYHRAFRDTGKRIRCQFGMYWDTEQ